MKKRIFILMMLACMLFCQVAYASSDDYTGITNGKDGIYTVNSSGDLKFEEYVLYEHYCQNIEFMKAYILEKLNKGNRDNVVYVGYHRVSELGKAARYLFFVPDDADIPLSDIIACPVSTTFGKGNYMTFYNKNSGELIKGSICTFNNSAYEGQISMQYNNFRFLCTLGGKYGIDCPKELLLSNIKIYGYDNDSQLSSEQCRDILNNAISGELKADNENSFLPERYGSIEPPQNLHFVDKGFFSNNKTTFSWTQTDENYKNWDTEIMIHGDIGYKLTIDLFGPFDYTGNLLLKTVVVKTSQLRYSVVLVELVQECRSAFQDIIVDAYGDWAGTHVQLQNCTFSFRNKYSDGQYTYYSNWVKVYIDQEGDYAIEYEYDDKINGDKGVDYSHNTPNGNKSPDSSYNGGSINSDVTFSGLTDFISDGFGLAGENGIIDMFSDVFSFIPTSVWTLILTGISVLIAIALLKAVL